MTPERFRQIEELYHAANEASPAERSALLARVDPDVRREVESLLAQAPGSVFLAHPEPPADPTITHLAGQTISHYRILQMLGAGGMGVVYKAFDTKLDRPVALKFLPPHLRHNEELKRRLKEEARAASTLDHPHIVVIHDIDETPDGDLFIAMAFHEGVTLRDRIAAAPAGLPPAEALQIARQIASGLARAHERSILHRDIKPGNVIVDKDGVARIIDFGLAKSSDATITADGSTKGTPLYMSPEQALGKPVDFRTDLWSLGAVLYEMLTGKPPFPGESQLQVMRAVVDDQPPPLREARPNLPPGIEGIVDRALQKDPAKRYQSAGEMALDLSAALAGIDPPGSQAAITQAAQTVRRRWFYGGAGLATLLLAGVIVWLFAVPRGPVTSPSEFVQLTNFSDSATAPTLSADGRMLTFFRGSPDFLGDAQVYVKMLPNGESRQLTNDSVAKYGPVFTPDGSRVAYTAPFTSSGTVDTLTVPVMGGPPSRLMANAAGLSWIGPDQILFSEIVGGGLHMGIVTAKENRSEERAIYFPAHERAMAHYSWLSPDRSSILIVEMDGSQAWQRCRVVPMDGKSAGTQVGPQGACTAAAWSPDGKWMYLNVEVSGSSHLWRQRWRNHAPEGPPEQITFGPTEERGLAVMPDGKSLIASVGVRPSSIWIHDSSGDHVVSQEGSASAPALSANGKHLYYLLERNTQSDAKDLWLRDLDSGKSDPLLPGLHILNFSVSPDESQVAYTVVGTGGEKEIFLAPTDRSAPPRLIIRGGDAVSFGPGGILIFQQSTGNANYLASIHTDGTGLKRIQEAPIADKFGVSPDGEWVAAGSTHSGTGRTVGSFLISANGLTSRQICLDLCRANWSPDGKYLYVTVGSAAQSNGRTYLLPIPHGMDSLVLPKLLDSGPDALASLRSIPQMMVAPGPDPEKYVFAKSTFQGNLFRIPLH